jgi:hypothetical protein
LKTAVGATDKKMKLIGLDIVFSATRRTSAIARMSETSLTLGRATSSWESRAELIGGGFKSIVTAMDGPLLRVPHTEKRACEQIFSMGLFQRRCKPGFSHIRGTGRVFREAGRESANQFANVTSVLDLSCEFPRAWAGSNLVEAFPNAFLGVAIHNTCFDNMPNLRRGKKFDWLYDQCLEVQAFTNIIGAIESEEVWAILETIQANRDHEERAALICLLTAAAIATGQYTAVGDKDGGYFFLPPWNLWAEWAQKELIKQKERIGSIEVWINGDQF